MMINPRVLLLWIILITMTGPLFVVTPIGSRCFFCAYIIMIIILCELLKSIIPDSYNKILFEKIKVISLVCCLAGYAYLFNIYYRIHQTDQSRLHLIQEDVKSGKRKSELYHLPFEGYLWCATPQKENDVWEERYKLFYDIPDNVDLVISDYKSLQ